MMLLRSPAKLNLFLKVTGKRSDGFHSLVSLFQAVNLYDTLEVNLHDKSDDFSCNVAQISDESNLVFRALKRFKELTGIRQNFSIKLKKVIPMQAGLGGGSSNAASTLYALNALTHHLMPYHQLLMLAQELGSDVPFFFSSGTALVTGRGENVEDVRIDPSLYEKELFIIKSQMVNLSTPEVFNHYAKTKLSYSQVDLKNLPADFEAQFGDNDLEKSSMILAPSLVGLKKNLQNHFHLVGMSGTGPSFFAMSPKTDQVAIKQDFPHLQGLRFIQKKNQPWY